MSAEARVVLPLTDGSEVQARLFRPAAEPRGAVSYVHGLQSHSGWFLGTAERLAAAGYLTLLADRRGAGLNPREQVGRADAAVLVQDVVDGIAHARRLARERGMHSGLPVGLIGHSLGGMLATLAVAGESAQARVDWLFLVAPALAAPESRRGWRQRASALRRVLGDPEAEVPISIPPEELTRDSEGRRFIAADPLALRAVPAGFLRAGARLGRWLRYGEGRIRCPVLLALAGEDALVDNARAEAALRRVCEGPVAVHVFDGCDHTLELGPAGPRLVPLLLDFLAAHGLDKDPR